jgi:hypothetical protein
MNEHNRQEINVKKLIPLQKQPVLKKAPYPLFCGALRVSVISWVWASFVACSEDPGWRLQEVYL